MVLVNGADGIGTGWMTKIPNFNPREIVSNLKRLIKGEEPKLMIPWFKNFRGQIEALDAQRYLISNFTIYLHIITSKLGQCNIEYPKKLATICYYYL